MRRKWTHTDFKMSSTTILCVVIMLSVGRPLQDIGLLLIFLQRTVLGCLQPTAAHDLSSLGVCDAARTRVAQRRKDGPSRREYLPSPSVETLSELAQATGAARFEARTEGKALVKRLIPENSEPDLDEVSHHGVIGKPGVDFPAFPTIPSTGFNCKNVLTGYYADLETDCQVFHICDTSRKISFLCPNGTIFSQSHLICDWWFKVDCASAPTLYQSSAEYYSNEQKKTVKVGHSLRKNPDFQQISDFKDKTQTFRRTTLRDIPIPSTTEKLHQRFSYDSAFTPNHQDPVKATVRSFQALFTEPTYDFTTHRPPFNKNFENRRKNLVQLMGNNVLTTRTTLPTYTDGSIYQSTVPVGDHNSLKEMQIAAETASFTNNNNRQFIQDYNNKNFRQFPIYSPTGNAQTSNVKPSQSTLTTLFVHDIRDKLPNQEVTNTHQELTTKRPTLIPYTKSYGNTVNEKHQPYTRPGVSLLRDYIGKEKNKNLSQTNEEVIRRKEQQNTFESATKLPTTRSDSVFSITASSDTFDSYSEEKFYKSTEPTYQERRERLLRKLNFDNIKPTEPTIPTENTEKYPNRPGRPGLIVPPSLTPKTLHTLAIYYATGLDNTEATLSPDEEIENTTPIDEVGDMDSTLPALFSKTTLNKYSSLFKSGANNQELLEEIKFDPNITNEIMEDLMMQQSQNGLASSPQIRELAQVFTHALSAYLQDPVQFRKVLSDIRPTHPSFNDMITTANPDTETPSNTDSSTTTNEEEDEILGFSDENKERPALISFRDPKVLKDPEIFSRFNDVSVSSTSDYRDINPNIATTTSRATTIATNAITPTTTPRVPFRCCGRISASYTTAAPTKVTATTSAPFTNTVAINVNTLAHENSTETATENSYTVPKYGGFQNNTNINDSPYGKGVQLPEAKPLSEKDYIKVTNLPTSWGNDNAEKKSFLPTTNTNQYDTNIIGSPSTVTISSTPAQDLTESIELENEEELQRAHSQSFIAPQNTVQRQSKNLKDEKEPIKKPSEDLEAPTLPENYEITTVQTTSEPLTINYEVTETQPTAPSEYFTSPDNDRTTNQFVLSSDFNSWHSTVILDPITVNDALSPTGDALNIELTNTGTAWGQNNLNNLGTTQKELEISNRNQNAYDQIYSSSQATQETTTSSNFDIPESSQRGGRQLKISLNTETPDLTTIADTVVEKAKEIMGGMNSTTTEKLINVMKKTRSKTVRRLILLLVQTCDDDHNSTAEASKKALLEALMAVSQKDMDELSKAETSGFDATETTLNHDSAQFTNSHRRMDTEYGKRNFPIRSVVRNNSRSGKSLNLDARDINSLSNPTTERITPTSTLGSTENTFPNTTPSGFTRTTPNVSRGTKKFQVSASTIDTKLTIAPTLPIPEARIANNEKTNSDTRAIELLKSLYTIAARWG